VAPPPTIAISTLPPWAKLRTRFSSKAICTPCCPGDFFCLADRLLPGGWSWACP
jgi:hypothetical protein